MAEEWVDIVDEHNQVTGTAPRSVMRKEKLLHRSSYIVITNFQGASLCAETYRNKRLLPVNA